MITHYVVYVGRTYSHDQQSEWTIKLRNLLSTILQDLVLESTGFFHVAANPVKPLPKNLQMLKSGQKDFSASEQLILSAEASFACPRLFRIKKQNKKSYS